MLLLRPALVILAMIQPQTSAKNLPYQTVTSHAELINVYLSALWNLVQSTVSVSDTHLRAHETREDFVCRLLFEKKKNAF